MPPKKPGQARSLDIAVVGAGLGGLSAAVGLARAGRSVTIYEKSSQVENVRRTP